MGLALFSITDKNPNDFAGGGGGCMCSPVKTAQCTPPYCTFQGTEMLAPRSPIPVLSLHCAQQFATKALAERMRAPRAPIDRSLVELEPLAEPDFPAPDAPAKAESALVDAAKKRSTRKAAL